MLAYIVVIFFLLPAVGAIILRFASNSLLRRAAVFFMAAVLAGGAVILEIQGGGVFRPPMGMMTALNLFYCSGSFAVLAGIAWIGLRWKNPWIMVAVAGEAVLLGWLLSRTGLAALGQGEFLLDHLSLVFLLLFDGLAPVLLFAQKIEGTGSASGLGAASLSILAVNGLVVSGHLIGLLFFWQLGMLGSLLSITEGRIGSARRVAESLLIVQVLGGISLLAGMLLCQQTTQSLMLRELLAFADSAALSLPVALLFVAGLAGASQFPFQPGLLKLASPASSETCAFFQGATVVNAGIYIILRLSPLFMNTWLAKMAALMGAFSFLAGAVLGLLQHETGRSLTYSTVSVMGLVIVLASLADLPAIYAAIWVVIFHGLAKSLLFLGAGKKPIDSSYDLWFIFAALSMILPPFGVATGIWVALEASAAGSPAVFILLTCGSLAHLMFWAKFLVLRWEKVPRHFNGENLCQCGISGVLALLLLLGGLFQIPLTQRFLTPILKETFSRFGDVAQAGAEAFIIYGFAGINPAGLLLIMAGGALVLRLLFTALSTAKASQSEPKPAEAAVESIDKSTRNEATIETTDPSEDAPDAAEAANVAAIACPETVAAEPELTIAPSPIKALAVPVLFPWLPVRRKLEMYCSLAAAGMILLLFEVIVR